MALWVDKHKPQSTSDLIGQGRNVSRIKTWLRTFDSSTSKPIFIYGPPGIGKTTAAHLCCKEMGYKTLEFNASDQRNKNIIKDVINTAVSTSRISFTQRASHTKDCIILDEVDGMAGNEDRGGISQLILEMRNAKKPMIFICNDGQHLKLRSLKEKCEVLEFRKPDLEGIQAVVNRVAQRENIPISRVNIRNLAESSDYDIRQILNSLSLFREGGIGQVSKTTRMNSFEAARKALTNSSKLDDKFECFFADYNVMPLFIFENYHKCSSKLSLLSKAADMFCLGDIVEKEIRSNQTWSLLQVHGLYSTVIPSLKVSSGDHISINFPQFLGKLSNTNKRMRLFYELNTHTCLAGKLDSDCLDLMSQRLGAALLRKDVDDAIEFMNQYALVRDDLDSIMELATWTFKPNPMTKVETKTKTAFTNAFKKRSASLPYFIDDKPLKKKKTLPINEFGLVDDGDDDEDDDREEDSVIKPKRILKGSAKEPSSSASSKSSSGKESKISRATSKSSSLNSKTSQSSSNGSASTTQSRGPSESNGSKSSVSSSKPSQNDTSSVAKSSGSSNGNSKPDKRPIDGGIARFFNAKKPKS